MKINFEKFCSQWYNSEEDVYTLADCPHYIIQMYQTTSGEDDRFFRIKLKNKRKFKYLKPYFLENLMIFIEEENQLTLSVFDPEIFDTFDHLAFTIYDSLDGNEETAEVENIVINAFQRFFSLFSKRKKNNLSTVIGLYGELIFLRELIQKRDSSVVRLWNGPDKNRHDFSVKDNSVEVKSRYREYDSLSISNEYQLYTDPPEKLFLKVYDFDVKEDALADSVKELIHEIFLLCDNIENKLILISKINEIGLTFNENFSLPESLKIDQLSEFSFEIRENFPRLTKQELTLGINSVKYKIQMSAVPENCEINNTDLWKHMK